MTRCLGWIALTTVGLALHAAGPAAAQDSPAADDAAATPPPGQTLIPLPVVFYQPETGTGFGAAASYYVRATGALQPSDVGILAIYTVKKQLVLSLATNLSLGGDRLRLQGEAGFSRFPTKLWGIGNDTPEQAEEDYTPDLWSLVAEGQRRIAPGWYAGATARIAYRSIRERADSGLLDTGVIPGAANGRVVLAGLLVTRDTRDNIVFPHRGSYAQATAGVATGVVGSDFEYTSFTLDLRTYVPVTRTHVLALRILGEARAGTPPFDLLPQLGGDRVLRGYYQGRFRDRTLIALQAEYRAPVVWRVGVVGFGAAGEVAPDLPTLRPGRLKPSVGVGLRFQISRREQLNLRADYGWGLDVGSSGFYLSIGEAF